jgi:hypothetical protein
MASPSGALVITQPVKPAQEACTADFTGFFKAPPELLDCAVRSCLTNCLDPNCARVIQPLRQAAQTRDASEILVRAAFEYYVLKHPELRPPFPNST